LLPPSPAAVEWVATRLRRADVDEMALIHGVDADDLCVRLSLLRASVAASRAGECWAAHDAATSEPVAVFGVAPTNWIDNEAAPWLLGTEALPRYGRDLVAMARDAVEDWSQRWSLVNRVDARNDVAVRWLRRVGFDVGAGPGLVTFRLGARV
uniref:hypothetical protein n=1 Tax=Pseudorhodoferax sp. TaxID=1993553 RepID=UPI002DD64C2C